MFLLLSLPKPIFPVVQESVLRPLLFLIYVNDMSAVVKHKLLLYADDAAILVSGTNIEQVQSLLSGELEMVSEWLIGNKLSLHLGKTESILFGSKSRLKSQSNMTISCHTNVIEAKTQVKYLGATLDQTLSCESMALSIIQKANARLKFLYRKRRYLTFITKKLLVISLIQCHFDYACSFWFAGLSQSLKNRLQTTQNKLIRFVLNLDQMIHVGPEHFKILNWLPVTKRVDQIILCHVFKIKSGTAPDYLGEYFSLASSVHGYSTRFRDNGSYTIPKVKGFGKKSFAYKGCMLWNDLPLYIRKINGLREFKDAVKNYLLLQ